MESIHQASYLNKQGGYLLAAGRPYEAFDAFNTAFDAIGSATISIKQAESERAAPASDLSSSRPKKPQEDYIQSISVVQQQGRWPSISNSTNRANGNNSGDCCKHFIYNQAFLFDTDHLLEVPSSHLCELFTAAVIFNMALTFQQRCEDSNPSVIHVAQATSLNLYYMTMQLINECACEFDCRSLLVAALNNTSCIYYDMNDVEKYEETQFVLRCLLTDLMATRPDTFEQQSIKGFLFNVTLLRRPFSAGAA